MRSTLLAATVLASPALLHGAAQAQPVSGVYIGGAGGANFMQQERISSVRTAAGVFPGGASNGFDAGVVGLGSIGYGFGNGVRVELEGNYRNNRFQVLPDRNTRTPVALSGGGREQKYGPMVNALFDLDIGSPYVFPYIGAGVGYAWVRQKQGPTAVGPGITESLGGTDSSFAYQAMAGLSFPVPPVVGLSLTAEYRYYALAGQREFVRTVSGAGASTSQVLGTKDNFNHGLMLGLRYAFNVAPPPSPEVPAAPAPAQTAARSYLVFFDWDRADLTDRARQVVAEAAQATARVQVTRIEVAGHADRSGTERHNLRLSQRRAEAVAAELVRQGVPRNAITTQGFGDRRPLVPTAKGVREPQNRRVEIVLR